MRRLGAAPTPRLPSCESELGWAIDEFQGGLRRSGPYRPDGLETRLDYHPKGSGGVGRPHPSCPQGVDLLGALAEESRNEETNRRAIAIGTARGKTAAGLTA